MEGTVHGTAVASLDHQDSEDCPARKSSQCNQLSFGWKSPMNFRQRNTVEGKHRRKKCGRSLCHESSGITHNALDSVEKTLFPIFVNSLIFN